MSIRKQFFTVRGIKHRQRLPRKAAELPSLEIFKSQDVILGKLLWVAMPKHRGWTTKTSTALSNFSLSVSFCISIFSYQHLSDLQMLGSNLVCGFLASGPCRNWQLSKYYSTFSKQGNMIISLYEKVTCQEPAEADTAIKNSCSQCCSSQITEVSFTTPGICFI